MLREYWDSFSVGQIALHALCALVLLFFCARLWLYLLIAGLVAGIGFALVTAMDVIEWAFTPRADWSSTNWWWN